MKEVAIIEDKKGNRLKVIYDFEKEILQGQNLTYSKPMKREEYKKIK